MVVVGGGGVVVVAVGGGIQASAARPGDARATARCCHRQIYHLKFDRARWNPKMILRNVRWLVS